MNKTLYLYYQAIGWYLLLTTPLLIHPVLYLLSVSLCLIYGWIAWALFSCSFWLIQQSSMEKESKWILLYNSIPISIGVACYCMHFNKGIPPIWHNKLLMALPLAAIVATTITIAKQGKAIWENSLQSFYQLNLQK